MLYELFKVQNREFEYDIDAKSGEILKYEVDGRAGQGGQRPSTEYIGLSNAEDIAFNTPASAATSQGSRFRARAMMARFTTSRL